MGGPRGAAAGPLGCAGAALKLRVLAVGKAPKWINDGVAHYLRRLPPASRPELTLVAPRRGATDEQRLLASVRQNEVSVILDRQGRSVSSADLAALLADWRMTGRDVALLIGGSAGFDAEARRSAAQVLSLSALTLPHQLVRVLLAEQLYRAWTILHHHPYHRA